MSQPTQPLLPPPPRTDIPRPEHLSEQDWTELMAEMAETPADLWRDTDGTIYSKWMPQGMAPPTAGLVDSSVALTPEDAQYGAFARRLSRFYDYKGIEVPRGQNPDSDADAG